MSEIRMVVTDLDGTLLKSDKHISEFTASVIEQMRQKGIIFAIATARPIRAVKDSLPWIPFETGVFHNGAVIVRDKEQISGYGISDSLKIVSAILKDHPSHHIAVEANDVMYANFAAEALWPGVIYTETIEFQELEGIMADKIIVEAHSLEEMHLLQRYLPEELYLQLSENIVAMILNKNATKMNGIRLLAKQYGIRPEQIVAFGDDYNDIDMLQACGVGIAMENALDEVKKAADQICQSNEEDGVARWIHEHL